MELKNYLAIISLSALFLSGCGQNQELNDNIIKSTTPVTVTNISIEPVSEILEFNAVSRFLKKSTIKSPINGAVENIEINPGDNVRTGQTLMSIKTKETLALEKSTMNDSTFNFNGLINVKASKDGIISIISHQNGDYVQEGDELASIAEPKSLIFLLEVPYELSRYLKKNAECLIVLPDGRKIKGIVGPSLPVMDIQSQIEHLVVRPEAYDELPENLIAKVRIIKTSKKEAVMLPKPAILTDESQSEFWIMKLINDSTAVKVPIKKGIESADKIEILQPEFRSADRILLTGNYELEDTARVVVVSNK